MERLLAKVAEILEVDEVKPTDILDGFEEWDSLGILSVIVMIDSDYHINLTSKEIRNSITGQGLLDLVARKTSR
jgi:acyl carrier protein